MTKDQIRQRAIEANSILNNAAFASTFDELRNIYVSKWESSNEDDTKVREMYYNRLKAIQEVKREFVKSLNAQRMIEKE